jgi:type VI secretion system protein ImpK
MFAELEQKGNTLELPGEDMQLAKYALTAFIDETILNSDWAGKEEWVKHPLQLEYFGTHMAGEDFYIKLDELRQFADSRIDALELLYTCIQLGFEGKYKILGLEKLMALRNEVAKDISRIRGREAHPLSVHGERAQGLMQELSREVPLWVVAVTCAAILFFLFTGLALWIGHDATAMADKLRTLL